jgi:glycosyltransferase involved in cell wall biosynthesis
MNIAILGTRGIPNNYGGFEQFAEYISLGLVEKGHDVTVYNSHNHPYKKNEWNDVSIIHQYDPEYKLGTSGQFIYDLNCILDSRRRDFDLILQLGYTSNSIWGWLLPHRSVIVTNMDGLEWKRSKYSKWARRFLVEAEKWAIKTSDYFISDSIGIKGYLKNKYNVESEYIAYGANLFETPDFNGIKDRFDFIDAYEYDMLIARMEPENNIEQILEAKKLSTKTTPLLVIGNTENKFGNYLKHKFFSDARIIFLGSIYDIELLDNLRYFSNMYFHGHSVGGTNPSLLEAMASQSLICAHKNPFNEAILEGDAFYFTSVKDLIPIIDETDKMQYKVLINNNLAKIEKLYNWPRIIDKYEKFLTFVLGNGKRKS